jgi:hypothetical protein
LIDFLQYLNPLLQLFDASIWNTTAISVFLGVGLFLHYSFVKVILGITFYALAIYYGRRMLAEGKLPLAQGVEFTKWEPVFILLGFAGLVIQMVRGLLFRFVYIDLPFLLRGRI